MPNLALKKLRRNGLQCTVSIFCVKDFPYVESRAKTSNQSKTQKTVFANVYGPQEIDSE
jgi:hypothetical protein